MKRGIRRYFSASLAMLLGTSLIVRAVFAADETKAPEPAKAEAPAATPAAPDAKAAEPAPKLPTYFTATSRRSEEASAWPDPTGAASGVWATPAGDAKGDIPEQLQSADFYDRIAHNLYSINYVWVLIAGFLVMFMQAGFMLVETGSVPREECGAHRGDELHDLSARLSRLLGLWLRHRLGQLVERPGAAGLVSVSRPRTFGT